MTLEERLEAASPDELRAMLEDARGESGACGDPECGCHLVPARIEEELEYRETPRPAIEVYGTEEHEEWLMEMERRGDYQ